MENINGLWEYIKTLFGDSLYDYIKNLIIPIIVFCVGRLSNKLVCKPQLRFLGTKPNEKWTLYFGNVAIGDSRTKAFEQSNQQYIYGDIESTLIVGEIFGSWFDKSPEYSRHFTSNDEFSGVLVSVGGPKWNAITERLIGAIGSPIHYKEGYEGLVVGPGNVQYDCKQSTEGSTRYINDIGVILVGKQKYFSHHPLGKVKAACVIVGYSTYGVRLAAEFLKTIKDDKNKLNNLLSNDIPSDSARFCILVHGKVKIVSDGEVNVPHIERYEVLTDSKFVEPYLYTY
jgi:hypothetical protein